MQMVRGERGESAANVVVFDGVLGLLRQCSKRRAEGDSIAARVAQVHINWLLGLRLHCTCAWTSSVLSAVV